MRKATFVVLAGSCAVLAACAAVDSDDVNTEGVYADLRVTADGGGNSVVYAALKVGGESSNTFLDLSGGDTLIAYQDVDSSVMQRNSLAGKVWYEAIFPTEVEDTPFKVSFLRVHTEESSSECVGASAPDSDVTLPASFNLLGPIDGTAFSRATDDVVITWDNSGQPDPMTWSAVGTCVEPIGDTLSSDGGTLTITAAQFEPLGQQQTETCDVLISITRQRNGVVDTAYGEGGEIYGRQLRQVTISSTP